MFKISVKKQNKAPQAHFRSNACTSVFGFFFFLRLNDFVNKMYFVYPKFGEMAVCLFLSAWKNTKKKKNNPPRTVTKNKHKKAAH